MLPVLCLVVWNMGSVFGETCFLRDEELGRSELGRERVVPFGVAATVAFRTIRSYPLHSLNAFSCGVCYVTDPCEVVLDEMG